MLKKKILSLIILSTLMLVITVSAYGTDSDLNYKRHDAGLCTISIQNAQGDYITYNINTSIRASGNQIYVKFDGTPQLPAPAGYTGYGSNACAMYGLGDQGLAFWTLVQSGSVEGIVDTCPVSAIDPNLYDSITSLQCNSLCHPTQTVCVDSTTLHICNADGTRIDSQNCALGCDGNHNTCNVAQNTLTIQTDQSVYSLGEDIYVTGSFVDSSGGIVGRTVQATLTKGGSLIPNGDLQSTTDSNGNVNFTFSKIATSGEISVNLHIANYLGQSYDATPKIIQVAGNSIKYEVATYSQTQYSSKNITFTVKMKDANGLIIIPAQITNLAAVATLTSGTVSSSEVTYKGEGLYEISSTVEGSGTYVGKLAFNFQGQPQSSYPVIQIDVRPMSISIDVSKISPGAYLNDTMNYTISIFDATGQKLDPDNIMIEVSLPDGTTVQTITFDELTKVSDGVYTFPFTYSQVEKHTFNIYADYSNYARGSAKASVAVDSNSITGPGIPGIGIGIDYAFYIIAAIVIVIVIVFIVKMRKK